MRSVPPCLMWVLIVTAAAAAQESSGTGPDPRLDWWRQARVGLMIDWALAVGGSPEKVDAKDYSADEWMRFVRDVGAKYVVVTAKSSNGFSLYRSSHTDFDVVDATPLRRDVLGELSDAARAQDIPFGWAYSIADGHRPVRSTDDVTLRDYVKFVEAQTGELLTRYGPVAVCRYDHAEPSRWDEETPGRLLELCRRHRPEAVVSGLGTADHRTVELETLSAGTPEGDWEARVSAGPVDALVRALVDVAGRGGNLLIEVRPDEAGRFPHRAAVELKALGAWLDVNGESIYGTRPSPFPSLGFGRCTVKTDAVYLHVVRWPRTGVIWLPGLENRIRAVQVLGAPDVWAKVSKTPIGYSIAFPPERPDLLLPVVKLVIHGEPEVEPVGP